ncbi:MAG: FIVAR domain-containing protein [Treponema sp.]|nr:FIVAR domain-containing protein [Treponema sp.]
MKHHTLKWAGVITILAFLAVSCGGDGDPPPGIDRSGLGAAIATAQAMLAGTDVSANGADVHDNRYWTSGTDRGILQSAIDSARSVYNNPAATQAAINAAATIMRDATDDFDDARAPGTLPTDQVSLAGLNTAISDAIALRNSTEEAQTGASFPPTVFWATQAAHNTFQAAITAATTVRDNADSTQAQVDTARDTLIVAHGVFNTARSPGTLDPHGGFLGLPPVHLSGQVYTVTRPDDFAPPIYTLSNVNATVTSSEFYPSTIGTIANGILDVTLGTPSSFSFQNIQDSWLIEFLEDVFNNVTVSDNAVQIAELSLGTSDPGGNLGRGFSSGAITNFRDEYVRFMFVSADVTIGGTGRPNVFACDCVYWDGACYCEEDIGACYCAGTLTTTTFSITLRQGWNAILGVEAGNAITGAMTMSLYHRNPGPPVRWVHSVWDGGGFFADSLDLSLEPAIQERPGRANRWLGGRR